jgi:hypothetical protein
MMRTLPLGHCSDVVLRAMNACATAVKLVGCVWCKWRLSAACTYCVVNAQRQYIGSFSTHAYTAACI